jgi:ABC-2 type transport system permease protein
MHKFFASIVKEFLILLRDYAGLAILFIMPAVMIIVITLVQDTTFKTFKEAKIPIIIINNDKDTLGNAIEKGIIESSFFEISTAYKGKVLDEKTAQQLVASGKFQIGIVIAEGTSNKIRQNATFKANKTLTALGFPISQSDIQEVTDSVNLKIFIDPALKKSFKSSVLTTLEKYTSKIEMKIALKMFIEEMAKIFPKFKDLEFENTELIHLQESYASNSDMTIIPTSTQHNVPSWTMFAMFFIVLPLSGSIIKEREEGSLFRLMTMPGSYFTVMSAKATVYIVVCLLQLVLMLLEGIFVLPLMGLSVLDLGTNYIGLAIIGISSAFAATGYGMLVGTVATSQIQGSSFGSISIIILAAIGGVWVPEYVMPAFMKTLSSYSPLNWGLDAFYNIFVRNSDIKTILPDSLRLFAFFISCSLLSVGYFRLKYRN